MPKLVLKGTVQTKSPYDTVYPALDRKYLRPLVQPLYDIEYFNLKKKNKKQKEKEIRSAKRSRRAEKARARKEAAPHIHEQAPWAKPVRAIRKDDTHGSEGQQTSRFFG